MTILHFITSLRTGGAEHLLVDLLPRLRTMGHSVELLLLDGTRTPFYEQLERQGIAVHSLGMGAGAMHNPLLLFRLKAHLKKHHYDIVHTHNTPCQLLMAMAGRINHTTLVTTEHNTSNRRRSWGWYRNIDRWMYCHYARIICVTKETERKLTEALNTRKLEERICTVNNGIDTRSYMDAAPNADLQRTLVGKHIIIMVAAFRKQKDQQTLIRAMQLLTDDYRLLLAGEGECRSECETLVKDMNLQEKVVFLGVRSRIASLLKTSETVVMSSHYEGLSLSSLEGMASGKPVIASDVPGLRDIVGGAGLLFPHEDHHRLAQLIRQVCEDEAFGRQVAARCRERAVQYDISRMVAGYMQVYETLLKTKDNEHKF